jgi:hypothetical protein
MGLHSGLIFKETNVYAAFGVRSRIDLLLFVFFYFRRCR